MYKLKIYKTSGAKKGNKEREEFFRTKEELDKRYKELSATSNDCVPTALVKTTDGYERLLGY